MILVADAIQQCSSVWRNWNLSLAAFALDAERTITDVIAAQVGYLAHTKACIQDDEDQCLLAWGGRGRQQLTNLLSSQGFGQFSMLLQAWQLLAGVGYAVVAFGPTTE